VQHPRRQSSSWIIFSACLITKLWIHLSWHRAVLLLFLYIIVCSIICIGSPQGRWESGTVDIYC
jgi:hypothetical protein